MKKKVVKRTVTKTVLRAPARRRKTAETGAIGQHILDRVGPAVPVAGKGGFSSQMDSSKPLLGPLGTLEPMEGESHRTPRNLDAPPRPRKARKKVVVRTVRRSTEKRPRR